MTKPFEDMNNDELFKHYVETSQYVDQNGHDSISGAIFEQLLAELFRRIRS